MTRIPERFDISSFLAEFRYKTMPNFPSPVLRSTTIVHPFSTSAILSQGQSFVLQSAATHLSPPPPPLKIFIALTVDGEQMHDNIFSVKRTGEQRSKRVDWLSVGDSVTGV